VYMALRAQWPEHGRSMKFSCSPFRFPLDACCTYGFFNLVPNSFSFLHVSIGVVQSRFS
jgi:hypothetical protein